MKRKDWKIKKSIKGIYGKKKKTVRLEKIFMLRKLFVRKNKLLYKKNLMSNYYFYNGLVLDFFKKKNEYLDNFYIFNNLNYNVYSPTYFYSKKVFNFYNIFLNVLDQNSLKYFFLNKNHKKVNDLNNNKLIIINNNVKSISSFLTKKEKEEEYSPITVKYTKETNVFNNELSFLINYNINILINLEIYKILILLHYNKLK